MVYLQDTVIVIEDSDEQSEEAAQSSNDDTLDDGLLRAAAARARAISEVSKMQKNNTHKKSRTSSGTCTRHNVNRYFPASVHYPHKKSTRTTLHFKNIYVM